MDGDFVRGLRSRAIDVITTADAGMIRRKDEEHLSFASTQGRALYSFNVGDFHSDPRGMDIDRPGPRGYHSGSAEALLDWGADSQTGTFDRLIDRRSNEEPGRVSGPVVKISGTRCRPQVLRCNPLPAKLTVGVKRRSGCQAGLSVPIQLSRRPAVGQCGQLPVKDATDLCRSTIFDPQV